MSESRDLIAVRVLREQEWAYARRLEHLSYQQMRVLVNEPAERGGLGYDLSLQALKGLVKGYRDRMREVAAVDLDEQRERELHDLDVMQRALGRQLAVDERDGKRLDPALVREYRALGAERRALLGLDAPTVARVELTDHAAVTAELNEMLVRAGHKPIETDQ